MLLRRQRSAALRPFLHDWPNEPAIRRTHSSKRLPVLDWAGEAVTVPVPVPAPAPATAPLVRAFAACMERLAWAQSYTEDEVDRSFLDRYGWSELIGMRGPIPGDRLACGFLLLGPETTYPDHHHAAEEVYLVLSGTAFWRRGVEPWQERGPGAPVHHAPSMSHAMRTAVEPLLALYLWRGGDLTEKSILS